MILKIVTAGDPILRAPSKLVSAGKIRQPEIQTLIDLMRETMREAPGVGLAAPQIGRSLQLAVIEDREETLRELPPAQLAERERKPVPFHVIVNPKLKLESAPELEFYEGCLSLPGLLALTPRARQVTVECLDHRGEPRIIRASGWYARILQHEIDHLHGALYIDRMRSRSLTSVDNYMRHWKDKSVAQAQKLLE